MSSRYLHPRLLMEKRANPLSDLYHVAMSNAHGRAIPFLPALRSAKVDWLNAQQRNAHELMLRGQDPSLGPAAAYIQNDALTPLMGPIGSTQQAFARAMYEAQREEFGRQNPGAEMPRWQPGDARLDQDLRRNQVLQDDINNKRGIWVAGLHRTLPELQAQERELRARVAERDRVPHGGNIQYGQFRNALRGVAERELQQRTNDPRGGMFFGMGANAAVQQSDNLLRQQLNLSQEELDRMPMSELRDRLREQSALMTQQRHNEVNEKYRGAPFSGGLWGNLRTHVADIESRGMNLMGHPKTREGMSDEERANAEQRTNRTMTQGEEVTHRLLGEMPLDPRESHIRRHEPGPAASPGQLALRDFDAAGSAKAQPLRAMGRAAGASLGSGIMSPIMGAAPALIAAGAHHLGYPIDPSTAGMLGLLPGAYYGSQLGAKAGEALGNYLESRGIEQPSIGSLSSAAGHALFGPDALPRRLLDTARVQIPRAAVGAVNLIGTGMAHAERGIRSIPDRVRNAYNTMRAGARAGAFAAQLNNARPDGGLEYPVVGQRPSIVHERPAVTAPRDPSRRGS
jgi:hypothetical protein